MRLICLLLCTLLPLLALSQSQEMEIANSICNKLSSLDLTEPTTVLNQKSISAMQQVYQGFQSKSADLIEGYRKKYPNKSDIEITKAIGQEVTALLMHECIAYQRITMFNAQPVPEISDAVTKVGKDFTLLLTSKGVIEELSQGLIDECIVQVMDQNSDLILKAYGNISSPKFMQEFQAYLMTESIPYIRWVASQLN
ncbi:hypothetical protein SAMN04489724_3315 [Algoriphagus locisalis]|uniref:Uncharacterized protein n=1 Tax=Algoriphagus locisalis TaxID=305507 RepID=A0A1I7CQG3_9BACT|nr:hypothetical protein [Algoriphagus locisalis]SFU01663.1 hypothetical protein SAMN04489724_3315 [Algoriphagus locisalis]